MVAESVQGSREVRSQRSGLRFLLVFLLILALVSALLHVEKLRRLKGIRLAKEEQAALARARPVEQTMARRARFYQTQYCLDYPEAASFAIADISRRLSGIFRPGEVLSLQVDPGVRDLRFELAVGIHAGPGSSGAGAVLEKFAGRYGELGDFPDVSDLSFTEKDPADGGLHVFTITGQAELP